MVASLAVALAGDAARSVATSGVGVALALLLIGLVLPMVTRRRN